LKIDKKIIKEIQAKFASGSKTFCELFFFFQKKKLKIIHIHQGPNTSIGLPSIGVFGPRIQEWLRISKLDIR